MNPSNRQFGRRALRAMFAATLAAALAQAAYAQDDQAARMRTAVA